MDDSAWSDYPAMALHHFAVERTERVWFNCANICVQICHLGPVRTFYVHIPQICSHYKDLEQQVKTALAISPKKMHYDVLLSSYIVQIFIEYTVECVFTIFICTRAMKAEPQ